MNPKKESNVVLRIIVGIFRIVLWILKGIGRAVSAVFEIVDRAIMYGCCALILVVGVLYLRDAGCQAGRESSVETGKITRNTEEGGEKPLDWHKAETKLEMAERIRDRLVGELERLGLDASNMVANAKSHPTRLVSRVPEHKRTRLLALSKEEEGIIAKAYVEECRKKGLLADDPAAMERIRGIVERLFAVVPEIDAVPEIFIFRDDSVNACCLPDGTVFVNTGTLERIGDDDMLAAIMAHELGHAAARHGNEDVTRALAGAAGGVLTEEVAARFNPVLDSGEGVSLVRTVYGLGTAVGFRLPRDRQQEAEADRLGVRYLARAGFDPEAMGRLFQWFEALEPQGRSVFLQLLSTHPLHADRIDHVQEVLREADLREMPKTGWFGKAKKKADETDFTAFRSRAGASNEVERLPEATENNTNAPSRFPKIPKIPWKRKGEVPNDQTEVPGI